MADDNETEIRLETYDAALSAAERLFEEGRRAVAARVAYVPGTAFHADGRGSDHVRLSFCFPTPERLVEGVRRLVVRLNTTRAPEPLT